MFNENELNLPNGHFLEQIDFDTKVKKSEDMDITTYNEKNENGEFISKYKIYEITNTYPPFSQYTNYERYDINDNLIEEGRL